MKGDIANRIEY